MMQQTPVPPMPPMPPMDAMTLGVPGSILFIILVSVVAATVILWPIVRALARRLEGKGTVDAGLKADVEHLHQRLGEVDALQARLAELEERLDFTERMLARTPEAPTQLHRGDVP
jgi:Tfp pilus assembly protein PilO